MKGLIGWFMVIIIFLVMMFIIVALASGNSVGDGVIAFFATFLQILSGIWNVGS